MTDAATLFAHMKRFQDRKTSPQTEVDYWCDVCLPQFQTLALAGAKKGEVAHMWRTPFDFKDKVASDGQSVVEKIQRSFEGCRVIFQELRGNPGKGGAVRVTGYRIVVAWDPTSCFLEVAKDPDDKYHYDKHWDRMTEDDW